MSKITTKWDLTDITAMPTTGPVWTPASHRVRTHVCLWANATAAGVGHLCKIYDNSGVPTADYPGANWGGDVGVILERTDLPGHAITDTYDQNDDVWVRKLDYGDKVIIYGHAEGSTGAVSIGTKLHLTAGLYVDISAIGTNDYRFAALGAKASAASTTTTRIQFAEFRG